VDSLCIVHDDNDLLQNAIKSMGEIYRNSILTIAVVSASAAFPLHLDLKGSKYESRAWIYQERLLSTRALYITKSMAYYHCSKHEWSE
ncbi:uncharacterized protein BDZ99DRAFT_340725, partial [Mytilinidion resinicola]